MVKWGQSQTLLRLRPNVRSRDFRIPLRQTRPSRRNISAYGYEQSKALVFSTHGEPSDVLSLHSHSISPPHGNLLTLRFLAAPINPADINQIQGSYPSKPNFTTSLGTADPIAVGGNEGVAEVLAAGKDASAKKGDWVIMRGPGFGTWRTHAQGAADKFVVLDAEQRDGITPVQAGTVSINPCTAHAMLRGYIGGGHSGTTIGPGSWFIQNGANSGVGRAAIQLGRHWGLKSINVIRARPEGAEATAALRKELEDLGADIVVTEEEIQEKGWSDRVKEYTNGGREPVRLALNCVGGRSALQLAKVLAPSGWHVTYGAMAKQPLSVPAGLLIFRNLRFSGFWVSEWSRLEAEMKKSAVTEILQLTRDGKFKDTPFEEVKWDWKTEESVLKEAVQGTLDGFRKGKSVFVFGET